MGIRAGVRIAFTEKLKGITNLPEVAWENKGYTPKKGTPYVAPFLLPAPSRQGTLFKMEGSTEHSGIYQINVYFPGDTGLGDIEAFVDTLCESEFAVGTIITSASLTKPLTVTKAYSGSSNPQQDWVMIPVSIHYSTYV